MALGVHEQPGHAPLRNLVQAFWDRSVLVVLDNCEYLLERCAELAEAVGHDCPLVRFVATSREPLGVEGEHVWRVPSLSVPISDGKEDLEELAGFTSIELFVARARAHQHDFNLDRSNAGLVGSLCRRLDGIPLALELVAARLGSLPVAEVARHLHDRFELLSSPGAARCLGTERSKRRWSGLTT